MNLAEVAITDHALMRFQRRLRRPRATAEDVASELQAGRFRSDAPYAIDLADEKGSFGYVVTSTAVFAIARSPNGKLCATTCFRRRRRSKADRRAYREMIRGLL